MRTTAGDRHWTSAGTPYGVLRSIGIDHLIEVGREGSEDAQGFQRRPFRLSALGHPTLRRRTRGNTARHRVYTPAVRLSKIPAGIQLPVARINN